MKISHRILRAIRQAPGTSSELGAILFPKMNQRAAMRRCSAHLCNLRAEGKLKVIGFVPRNNCGGKKIMSNLWGMK